MHYIELKSNRFKSMLTLKTEDQWQTLQRCSFSEVGCPEILTNPRGELKATEANIKS